MLSDMQVEEIREHLEKAQNPLFFFDNDNDGLTSYLLLRRFIERGRGISIKSYPGLDESYYKRVEEINPDYIFILDKPEVSEEFLKKAKDANLQIVWIDHHQSERPDNNKYPNVSYYNPYLLNKTNEPVSYICYKITGKKEDIWIAVIGCISDHYLPDFYDEFVKRFPELAKKNPEGKKKPFDVLYNSEIGRIARILDFSLRDSTTNVVKMLKFMVNVKGPMEILEENSITKHILNKFEEINKRYQQLIARARDKASEKLIYFKYEGEVSMSSNLANQLSYEFPDKVVIVVYLNGDLANVSLRWSGDVRKLTLEAIKGIEGSSGGGHREATGAKMLASDLPIFEEKIKELIENN